MTPTCQVSNCNVLVYIVWKLAQQKFTHLNTQFEQLNLQDPAAVISYFNSLWLDGLLTLQRTEKLQASFIVSLQPSESRDIYSCRCNECAVTTPHHNHFTALFPGPPGWAGARRELLDLWCKGRLTEAYTLTIRLGATPSGLNQYPPLPSPLFNVQLTG